MKTARKRPLDPDSLIFTWECLSSKPAKTAEARGALNQALAGGLQEPLHQRSENAPPRGPPAGSETTSLGIKPVAQAGEEHSHLGCGADGHPALPHPIHAKQIPGQT